MDKNSIGFLIIALHGILFIAASPLAQATTDGDLFREIAQHPEIYGQVNIPEECRAQEIMNRPRPAPDVSQISDDQPTLLQNAPGLLRTTFAVVNYGGATTNRIANFGWINYARDLLLSDPTLFRAAFLFYSRLRDLPQMPTPNRGDGLVSIERLTRSDVYQEALNFAHNDRMRAFAILAIYGHDDMGGELGIVDRTSNQSDYCTRVLIDLMDSRHTNPSSPLFAPGALSGISYSQDYVSRAQRIATACAALNSLAARRLCNDDHESGRYMADCYHVISAAFLGCRSEIDRIANRQMGLSQLLFSFANRASGGDENEPRSGTQSDAV